MEEKKIEEVQEAPHGFDETDLENVAQIDKPQEDK